jgi:TRAP-type C4-dicarboxylate transport system permease small subunit
MSSYPKTFSGEGTLTLPPDWRGTALKHLLARINALFAEFSTWALSVIMILLIVNLITRFFGVPIPGLLELSTFVFVAVIYLGLAHAEEHDEHIKVNAILRRLPPRIARAVKIFNYTVAVSVGGIITFAAGRIAIDAYLSGESVPGTSPLPTYPVKIAIFVGILFFVLQCIVTLFTFLGSGDKGKV